MSQRWYVVNVYSGFEKKIAQTIKEQVEKSGLQDLFGEILVASEEVIEIRRGSKVVVEKNYFPGYVIVKMELTDESWHLVRNVPKVSGFLGGKGKPSPISEAEVSRIMRQVQESIERPRHLVEFEVGEQVRVSDGPFATFNGVVEDVDNEKTRLKVSVMIFGRPTPVELEFNQVEKIA